MTWSGFVIIVQTISRQFGVDSYGYYTGLEVICVTEFSVRKGIPYRAPTFST